MSSPDGLFTLPEFEPSFTGGRQETAFLKAALEDFWEDQLITDVVFRVKGGKEANVYACRAHPVTGERLLAAKVFRPRRFRAMKNDSLYKQGRTLMDEEGKFRFDSRALRALRKKTRYGKALDTAAWVMAEYSALVELHEAGADVPKPIASAPHAILMEFVGDEDGAAPILQSLSLHPSEAQVVFDRLIENVVIMLRCFRVHADLSAYNVLYQEGELRVIDLPQVVDALRHPTAFELFARDIDRLCRYFERQGLELAPAKIAFDLWEEWIG